MPEEKKTREFTIPVKSIADRIILLGVLGILGGPGVISMVVPGARPLSFTSEDGTQLREEIRRECEKNLSFIQSQIDETKATDDILEEKYHAHSHEAPPRWVIERLNHIEQELHRLGAQ